MRKILQSFFGQFAFWILFFNIARLIFILYYLDIVLIEKIRFTEILGIFYYSLKLDLATACYIMVFPFMVLLVQTVWSPGWLNMVNRVYSAFILFGYSLTTVGEMGIYAEWKTKLTYKVLKYLAQPAEIYDSSETGTFFLLLLFLLIISAGGIYAYSWFFFIRQSVPVRKAWFSIAMLVIVPPAMVIGMRGGLQQIPINQSQSYYSDHNILNIAAVNNGFNLYISIFENLANFDHNPYVFMKEEHAGEIMKNLYPATPDTTTSILTTQRPNIVLLILESWSADLIESLGGEPGITPEFQQLEKQGILFGQLYSSGARSEQGMASIFSGFPAHPISSITVQPDKLVKLPSIVKILEEQGYTTAFHFGGQLIYGNIKSYIIFNGFDRIMEGKDYPDSLPQGKLGIHDQYTLAHMLREISTFRQPFFTSLFTLSTHAPWDQPFAKPLPWGDNEREYINAAYYTDHCLGEFFRKASEQPWYHNTLFVIVADHNHNSYRNWHPYSREYHRIPMLFCGEVIREQFRGTTWEKLGNQHDLPATLLAQLGLPSGEFYYSKDLLNPKVQEFAYFSTEDGVGWIRPWGYFTWDAGPDFYYWWTDPNLADSLKQEGKAYLQTVFGDYMSR